MAINNLGYFVSPLTKEEREIIIPVVSSRLTGDASGVVRTAIRETSRVAFNSVRNTFDLSDVERMRDEINDRFNHCFSVLKEKYPEVIEIWDTENLKFEVKFDWDGVPSIDPQGWLREMLQGNGTVTLNYDKVTDTTLTACWRRISWQDESLITNNLSEEMKPIVVFNDKLNELIDGCEYDFTDIIKDIIKAVKEGKL